jgi:hypothetical protein
MHGMEVLRPAPGPDVLVFGGGTHAAQRPDLAQGRGASRRLTARVVPDQRRAGNRTAGRGWGETAAGGEMVGSGGYRSASGMYWRSGLPMYSWRGRPMRESLSWSISRHWAIQPGSRPIANSTVNMSTGNPSAR